MAFILFVDSDCPINKVKKIVGSNVEAMQIEDVLNEINVLYVPTNCWWWGVANGWADTRVQDNVVGFIHHSIDFDSRFLRLRLLNALIYHPVGTAVVEVLNYQGSKLSELFKTTAVLPRQDFCVVVHAIKLGRAVLTALWLSL